MTDLLIWLLTSAIAYMALRYIPINLSMKGRMVLWLSGCLISALAVLATITYTFWIGVLAALLLGFVFSVFLQNKVSHEFDGGKEESKEPTGKENNNSRVDEFNFWNQDNIEDVDIIEDDDSETEDESFSDGTSVSKSEKEQIDFEEFRQEDSGSDSRSSQVGEMEEAVDLVTEEEKDGYNDEEEYTDSEDTSLLEEELTQKRINEESLIEGEDIDETEEVTEEELMAERNMNLDFDEEDFTPEPSRTVHDEEDQLESEETDEWKQDESETPEVEESANSDKDIPQEMNGKSAKEIEESISVPNVDSDIEDDGDSLSLGVEKEEKVADEALRKQLLELMIEKIDCVEGHMNDIEYEAFVKAHLSEELPDLEYYSISKFLIRFYIKHGKGDELELFTGELIEKFSSYSLILEELNYVIQQQVQYTK